MKKGFSAVVKPQKAVHPSTVIAMQLVEAIRGIVDAPYEEKRYHFPKLVTDRIHPLLIDPPASDSKEWTEMVERLRAIYVCNAPKTEYAREFQLSELERHCLDYLRPYFDPTGHE